MPMTREEIEQVIEELGAYCDQLNSLKIAVLPPDFKPLLIVSVQRLKGYMRGFKEKLQQCLGENVRILVHDELLKVCVLPEIHLHIYPKEER